MLIYLVGSLAAHGEISSEGRGIRLLRLGATEPEFFGHRLYDWHESRYDWHEFASQATRLVWPASSNQT
jgi:hypothetical protein